MDTRQILVDDILECPLSRDICTEAVILTTGQTCDHPYLKDAIKATYQSDICELASIPGNPIERNPFAANEIMFTTASVLPNHVYTHIIECLNQTPPAIDTLLNWLRCPITQNYFENPVVASDGYTYERKALVSYLAKHKNMTPRGIAQTHPLQRKFTNPVVAEDKQVYEYEEIERYLKSHREYTPTGEKQFTTGERQLKLPYYHANKTELKNAKTPVYRNLIVLALLNHEHIKQLIQISSPLLPAPVAANGFFSSSAPTAMMRAKLKDAVQTARTYLNI